MQFPVDTSIERARGTATAFDRSFRSIRVFLPRRVRYWLPLQECLPFARDTYARLYPLRRFLNRRKFERVLSENLCSWHTIGTRGPQNNVFSASLPCAITSTPLFCIVALRRSLLTIPRGRTIHILLRAAFQHSRALEEYSTFAEDLITLPCVARLRAYSCLHILVPQPPSCAVSCRFRLTHAP
jgi:hypothetical protein